MLLPALPSLSFSLRPCLFVQVHCSAQTLKLVTFDADGTLYADGHHIEHDNEMIRHIITLMRRWVCAAGGSAGMAHGAVSRSVACAEWKEE